MRKKAKVLKPEQYKAVGLLAFKDFNKLSNEQIAEQAGVSVATLYNWKKDENFTQELLKQAEQLQMNFINDAYIELRSIINSKKVSTSNKLKAIELHLKTQGKLRDVKEQTLTVNEPASIADLMQELNKM